MHKHEGIKVTKKSFILQFENKKQVLLWINPIMRYLYTKYKFTTQ